MDTADHAVQEIKVKGSIRWTIKLDISAGSVPMPVLVRPSNNDPKYPIPQAGTKHTTDLNELDAGWRWSLNKG